MPLAKVVMHNLAKDPNQRAQGARAFGAQLAQAAKESNIAISEVGIVARLSNVDLGQRMSLDPTLDDAASPLHSPLQQIVVTMPTPGPTPVFGSLPPPKPNEPKKRPIAIIVLAFLLGAAIAVLITQQVAKRADAEHDTYVIKTRAALADSRYVTPPGDCVRDLVVAGLKRRPNDIDLLQLRSTASMELVSRAMVAQNGGDVGGARDLAHDATQLDPTDHSAALLLSQYDDEVKALGADTSATTGKPRVVFDALPITHAGKRLDLAARIAVSNRGARAKISDVCMTLFDHSATIDGVPIPVFPGGQALYRATMSAPKAGNYDVVFEATLEGTNIRAIRELTVLP